MRPKRLPIPRDPAAPASEELRGELERLGIAPDDAEPLARSLLSLARELPEREVRGLLAVLAPDASGTPSPATPELRRILEDFASELKKLDEGLRVLTAYLSRLRDHTTVGIVERSRTLH